MEKRAIRKKEIERLLQAIGDPDRSDHDQVFEELCRYFGDEDIECIYESLRKRGDTQSIYWLIKYLVRIERPLGFKKLFLLAQSENAQVRREASSGITHIDADAKLNLLIRMLSSRWKEEIRFAAIELGKLNHPKASAPLLAALKEHRSDEDICISISRAFGLLQDVRSLRALKSLTANSKGRVQEQALKSLIKSVRKLRPGHIAKFLSSENPKIKEIAYLTLTRFMDMSWEKYFARALAAEKNEALKISALPSVRNVRTRGLFNVVLNLALNDNSRLVRMMARSIIRRVGSDRILKWLVDEEKSHSGFAKITILYLISEFERAPSGFKVFKENYLNSDDNKIKVVALECMGRARDEKAIPFLAEVVKKNNPYSYAAALSLARLIDERHCNIVEEIFSLDHKKAALIIQVFLNFILHLSEGCVMPKEIQDKIISLTVSDSEYIRFLAIGCFAKLERNDRTSRLLNFAKKGKCLSTQLIAIEGLIKVLNDSPDELLKVLLECGSNHADLIIINRIFCQITSDDTGFAKALHGFLNMISESALKNRKDSSLYTARLMVVLRNYVVRYKAMFVEQLASMKCSDKQRWIMMRVLNRTDICELSGINVDFMAGQCKAASHKTKLEFLEFFRNMRARSAPVEKILLDDLTKEDNEALKKKTEEVLAFWIQRLSTAQVEL